MIAVRKQQYDHSINGKGSNDNDIPPGKASKEASSSKSHQALLEVRKRFLEYAEANPDKVNDRDKQKLATDDWYLKRYLLARNRNVKDTLEMLRKTMDWRNDFGIHMSEDAMFPLEFYKIGALFPYENDKKGNLVLYLRIKYHRKISEMVEVEKHFLVHTFEKIDRITNGQGLVIVFDCQDAGYANCDIEFLQFLISCATEHAPVGLQYIIVYKLPWVLNAFWSLARKLLPAYLASRVKFCDEHSVQDLIEPQNLPDFMGGKSRRNYRWIPPGCPSVFKLANAYGITDAEINKILPQFQALLDEADEALNGSSYDDPPDAVTKYVNNSETASTLLSDIALYHIGLGPKPTVESIRHQSQVQSISSHSSTYRTETEIANNSADDIRLFPNEFVDFMYDSYNDVFHGTITLFNPSKTNSLAFKLMSNRPSSYSVKPARGVLLPDTTITLSVVLLDDYKLTDKFLVVGQPIEGQIESITKTQFDSLWSEKERSELGSLRTISNQVNIKLGSYLRKLANTHAVQSLQSVITNPLLLELTSNCRSLKRRQTLSIMINVLLLIIIVHLLFLYK